MSSSVNNDSNSLKEKIKIAKEAVENEEEPFRTEAFKMILQNLLGTESAESKTSKHSKPKRLKSKISRKKSSSLGKTSESIIPELLKVIDVSQLNYIKSLEKIGDKCIALLDFLSEKAPQYMHLTTDELKTIFGDKFALTTITGEAISMALNTVTGKYVSRDKVKENVVKYRYTILTEGKKYIKNVITDLKSKK